MRKDLGGSLMGIDLRLTTHQVGAYILFNKDAAVVLLKEMFFFYLMKHTIHFIKCIVMWQWYRTTQITRGNPLPRLHGLLLPIINKYIFYMHHSTYRIVHTMVFVML